MRWLWTPSHFHEPLLPVWRACCYNALASVGYEP